MPTHWPYATSLVWWDRFYGPVVSHQNAILAAIESMWGEEPVSQSEWDLEWPQVRDI